MLHRFRVGGDEADFAAVIEFDFAQALAAKEDFLAVADDGLDVQADERHPADFEAFYLFVGRADEFDVNPHFGASFQMPDHLSVAQLIVINQQLPFSAQDKLTEPLARVDRADDKIFGFGLGFESQGVGFEQGNGFGDQFRVLGNDAKAAAVMNVQEGEVEGQQVKHAPVNDHHLAVIAHQIFCRACDGDARVAQTFFQPLDVFEVLFVGVSDEGVYVYAAPGGFDQSLFD